MGSYFLPVIISITIGIQIINTWIVTDLYTDTKEKNLLYAVVAYFLLLVKWVIDAFVYFSILPQNNIIQKGILPAVIAVALLLLAVPKPQRG